MNRALRMEDYNFIFSRVLPLPSLIQSPLFERDVFMAPLYDLGDGVIGTMPSPATALYALHHGRLCGSGIVSELGQRVKIQEYHERKRRERGGLG